MWKTLTLTFYKNTSFCKLTAKFTDSHFELNFFIYFPDFLTRVLNLIISFSVLFRIPRCLTCSQWRVVCSCSFFTTLAFCPSSRWEKASCSTTCLKSSTRMLYYSRSFFYSYELISYCLISVYCVFLTVYKVSVDCTISLAMTLLD